MRFKHAFVFKTLLPILLGSAVYAFGIHFFIVPNELMEGGVTGIALLLNYAFRLPLSFSTLALNIPLFYLGWRILGRKPMYLTIFGTLAMSFFLWVMELFIRNGWIVPFRFEQDFLLAALYAGLTLGTGLGIVFRYGGTTGGVDIIARIGGKRRGFSMGQMLLVLDGLIIGASLFYIPTEKVLYTLVLVFIASRMIDLLTKGADAAKAFMIITDIPEKISALIGNELERGVTYIKAQGAYSGRDKKVVYCIVYRHETRKLTTLVRTADPAAFVVVSDVQSVLGEGFKTDA